MADVFFQSLMQVKRGPRPVYFYVSCGNLSVLIFSHYFLRAFPDLSLQLSTEDKLHIHRVLSRMVGLDKISFVWTTGPGIENSLGREVPTQWVGLAERGSWSGRVDFLGLASESKDLKRWAALESFRIEVGDDFVERSQSRLPFWKVLQPEWRGMVPLLRQDLSGWKWALSYIFPALAFENYRSRWAIEPVWTVRDFSAFDQDHKAELFLDVLFSETMEVFEIESEVRRMLLRQIPQNLSFGVETVQYTPFRRSSLEGFEARALMRSSEYPLEPVILQEIGAGFLFREAGKRVFAFSPVLQAESLRPDLIQPLLVGSEVERQRAVLRTERILSEFMQ
jgi:hypothetical protein